MVQYITWLRALAACLITNSHYTGIYPTDLIANGGLIGDILFFAISGYCLFNIKVPFIKWYKRRIIRVYTPVIIGTGIILALGGYEYSAKSMLEWFLYPTAYHFVASIIILYIPFYIVAKLEPLRNHMKEILVLVILIMLIIYVFYYDYSYYHIDNVREPFIRLLFFASMLIGAIFRDNDSEFRNKFRVRDFIITSIVFCIYFASKIAFSTVNYISEYQLINQLIILFLLYFIMRTFAGIDRYLDKMPKKVNRIISFVANITLEIYIVQYAIIDVLRDCGVFPINWMLTTFSILIGAVVLNHISGFFLNSKNICFYCH